MSWRRWRSGVLYAAIAAAPLFFAPAQLRAFVELGLRNESYSYTLCIPWISAFFLFFRKNPVQESSRSLPAAAAAVIGLAAFLLWLGGQPPGPRIFASAMVFYWISLFVFFRGAAAAKQAVFPLALLFLTIPLPGFLVAKAIALLQWGSADVVYFLFKTVEIPVYRQGVHFALPGADISVAKECSGIRSCMALLITSTLAGYLYLRSIWSQAALCLLALPVAVFKNAVRIFAISWLGIYVNTGFFYGRLHRYGGLPFSVFAIALLLPLLLGLRRWEAAWQEAK